MTLSAMDPALVPEHIPGGGRVRDAMNILQSGRAVTDTIEYASKDEARKVCTYLATSLRYHRTKGKLGAFSIRVWLDQDTDAYRWAILPVKET
jgi:hypothetical protein